MSDKQYTLWLDAAFYGIWSGRAFFGTRDSVTQ